MTKACIDILGEDCLMHQSDYPHGQSWFPETAKEVIEWDFWKDCSKNTHDLFDIDTYYNTDGS